MSSKTNKEVFFEEIDSMPDTMYAYAIDEDKQYIFTATFNVKYYNKVISYKYDLEARLLTKQREEAVPFCVSQIQLRGGDKVFVAGSEILVFDYTLHKCIYNYQNENIEKPDDNNAIFGFNPFPLVGFVFAGEDIIGLTQQNILYRKLDDLVAYTVILPLFNFYENFCRFTEYSCGEKRFLLIFYRIKFDIYEQITGLLVHDFQRKVYFNVMQNGKDAKCNEQRIPGAFLDLKKLGQDEYKVLTTSVTGYFKVYIIDETICIKWISVKQHAVRNIQSLSEKHGRSVAITIDGEVYINGIQCTSPEFQYTDGYGTEIISNGKGQYGFFRIGADIKLLIID